MKIASVIAEYNPFHNGHLYQLNKIKEDFTDNIVVIMSSNFVQRGEPAIINKFERAKIAVDNGASLVIENPLIYSTSNADIFSKGAISILNSMGIIDRLYFGAEDNSDILKKIIYKVKNNLDNNKIKKYLDEGNSYIKARELSMDFLGDNEKEILKKPNNILGIEYIKALNELKSCITPLSIKRKNIDHDEKYSVDEFASASFIRERAFNGDDISKFIPNYDLTPENKLENYYDIFRYKLILGNIIFDDYFDYEVGLENRMIDNLNSETFDEFIEKVHSKRHSKSRIKRLCIEILLDIKKDLIRNSFNFPYIRVLALDKNGLEILKNSYNKNIIYSFKKFYDSADKNMKEILDKEIFATNLYNLKNGIYNQDFTREVYKKI